MKDYIIEYKVISSEGLEIKSGKVRAKNKMSALHAQVAFEDSLKNRYKEAFGKLIVIRCTEDAFGSLFGDMFGKDNPFTS